MKFFIKILIPSIIFSIVFFLFRSSVYYSANKLVLDINGLVSLYSTIVFIFAIFAAFVIFFEAERWNNLVNAFKGEVGQINELWFWSQHLKDNLKEKFSLDIKKYLETAIEDKNTNTKKNEFRKVFNSLHDNLYSTLKEEPSMMSPAFSAFSDLIKFHEKRIHYANFHLPKILKNTLLFNSILLILMSFFIGVYDIWLDYFFMLGIFTLVHSLFILIDDLDNPMRPGSFHMKNDDYVDLLSNINSKNI